MRSYMRKFCHLTPIKPTPYCHQGCAFHPSCVVSGSWQDLFFLPRLAIKPFRGAISPRAPGATPRRTNINLVELQQFGARPLGRTSRHVLGQNLLLTSVEDTHFLDARSSLRSSAREGIASREHPPTAGTQRTSPTKVCSPARPVQRACRRSPTVWSAVASQAMHRPPGLGLSQLFSLLPVRCTGLPGDDAFPYRHAQQDRAGVASPARRATAN